MLDVQSNDRLCAKCGAPNANYRDTSTSDFFCSDCFVLNIKLKFRFALTRTRLFSNSWNENKEPVRVLVLVERDARAEALLHLIDMVANEANEKRRFRLNTSVTFYSSNLISFIFRFTLLAQVRQRMFQMSKHQLESSQQIMFIYLLF
jgi:NMD protein affecting ribosome stability and mRNA decay